MLSEYTCYRRHVREFGTVKDYGQVRIRQISPEPDRNLAQEHYSRVAISIMGHDLW